MSARRQDRALCTIRSRAGTMTRIRPSGKHSRALTAAVIVFPDPVTDTPVARAPLGTRVILQGFPPIYVFADMCGSVRAVILRTPHSAQVSD